MSKESTDEEIDTISFSGDIIGVATAVIVSIAIISVIGVVDVVVVVVVGGVGVAGGIIIWPVAVISSIVGEIVSLFCVSLSTNIDISVFLIY